MRIRIHSPDDFNNDRGDIVFSLSLSLVALVVRTVQRAGGSGPGSGRRACVGRGVGG